MLTPAIMKVAKPVGRMGTVLIAGLLLLSFLSACAPALYSVDVKYTGAPAGVPAAAQQTVVTIAQFHDARPGGEDLQIGRVTTAVGGLTTVVPKNLKPSEAVSAVVKDVLVKSGYQVGLTMPAWNLQKSTLRKEWGRIVIGGNIDQLEIVCRNDIPIKTYDSRVKLTFFIADAQTGEIIRQIETASSNSLEHIYFSEEMMGQQISSAITDAVEKAFDGNTRKKMQAILKQTP